MRARHPAARRLAALVPLLAAGTSLAAPAPAGAPGTGVTATVSAGRTVLAIPARAFAPADSGGGWHALVALPSGAGACTATILAGDPAARVAPPLALGSLRGIDVVSCRVENPGGGDVRVELRHGAGSPAAARAADRLRARTYDAAIATAVAGLPTPAGQARDGAYVIVSAPACAGALAPLVEWKQRQGLPVVLVTTDATGVSAEAIRDWLRSAYDTWDTPPEHVLLVGDVAELPAFDISGTVTDLPYALLDGDDWLPDVMVGRFPAGNPADVATLVAKTVGYERSPYRDGGDAWFARSLMVAGNSGSVTPVTTVTWCGQQLQTLGFAPAATVFFPPLFNGVTPITNALESGVSMVVYRGWAYGTGGWEPPHFTVAEIPGVDNGARTPVVMSFVCLNGDFRATEPCFGESFLLQGTAAAPKGAVAFIGNGEHWSHTRFNDAMAIAFFERIVDAGVDDLGALMLAGKLRFMDYFPLELETSQTDDPEASVKFYFHIYSLLGDPGLRFWKGPPRALDVARPAAVRPGADYLEVTVRDADGGTPVAGARVGAWRDGATLGAALSDADGVARLALAPLAAGAAVELAVTASGRFPVAASLPVTDAVASLAATLAALDDGADPPAAGNGDGLANPGETLALTARLTNAGSGPATGVTAALGCVGPAAASADVVAFPDVPAGGQATGAGPFALTVDPTAEDGARLLLLVTAARAGGGPDVSQFALTVAAPRLAPIGCRVGGDGWANPGTESSLTLTLRNAGSAATAGGTIAAELVTPDAGELLDAAAAFGPLAPGAAGEALDPLVIRLPASLPVGSGLGLALTLTTVEGARQSATWTLVAGRVDVGAPVGPDAYGYRALDSADLDYPAVVPTFAWTELSPAYGGAGAEIAYAIDNQVKLLDLPFPFTYYGRTYTRIRVSDNGWISFDTDGALDFYNWPLPSTHGNHSLVAPFWDNFDPTRPEGDGVYWAYDAGRGALIVEWSRMRHYQPEIDDLQTFQVVLHDPAVRVTPTGDGEIEFLYKQVVNSDYLRTYATVGMEDPTEQVGLQLSYSNVYAPGAAPLSPGLAVRLTTVPPVRVPLTLREFAAVPADGGLRLSWAPADDRPVTGWLVERLDDAAPLPVGGTLPAGARGCPDAAADPARPHVYRLVALHPYGTRSVLGPFAVAPATAASLALDCRPNPAPGGAQLAFALPRGGVARLRIFDVAGRLVRTLLDGPAPAGAGGLVWDGRDGAGRPAGGGVYFCRLEAAGATTTRKLILVR